MNDSDRAKIIMTQMNVLYRIQSESEVDLKGGYLDFSHFTELRNIYITEIYIRKQ